MRWLSSATAFCDVTERDLVVESLMVAMVTQGAIPPQYLEGLGWTERQSLMDTLLEVVDG